MKKLMMLTLAALFFSGCATINKDGAEGDRPSFQTQSQQDTHFYYDFEDILIPKEMQLVAKDSALFETPRARTGALVFEGRVEPVSLFNFFLSNMPKDGWALRSYFKYNRYIQVYEKPDKDCIITIQEGTLKSRLQVWVAPRLDSGVRAAGAHSTEILQD
ncbi:MAG: hypothetical protein ACLFNV_04490 [Desulfovibrionales bacterium]